MGFTIKRMLAGVLSAALLFGTAGERLHAAAAEAGNQASAAPSIQAPENLNEQGYDVVFAIDDSGSVRRQQEERNQAFRNIASLASGSDVRIGVVYFTDQVSDVLALTSVEDQEGSETVKSALNNTETEDAHASTNIGGALAKARELFDAQDSSRSRIVILFSDGKNESGRKDASFAEKANQQTEKEAKKLKELGVKIYCVYLEKKHNDEAYLRQLVNYFSGKEKYTKERFSKLRDEDIDKLDETFVDVFYAMQGNMKYSPLNLDSKGSRSFYVPGMAVRRLRVFMDGPIEGGKLTPPAEAACNSWTDGTAGFYTYSEPPVGNWNIQINSSALDQIHGSICYYSDLHASAKIQTVSGEQGAQKQLEVQFYDAKGHEIELDPAAKVTAKQTIVQDEKASEPVDLPMTISDGVALSAPFDMKTLGRYSYAVNVAYEDFISFDYTFDGGVVERHAPVTYDQNKRTFIGDQTGSGMQFVLSQNALFHDQDGDAVTVDKIVQLNDSNQVSAEQKDGYIYFTAGKEGPVEFELQLKDATGMTSTVKVSGEVKDRKKVRAMRMAAVAAAVILLLVILLAALKKRAEKERRKEAMIRARENLEKLFARYEQQQGVMESMLANAEPVADRCRETVQAICEEDVPDLRATCEARNLEEDEERELLGCVEYLAPEFGTTLKEQYNNAVQGIDEICGQMSEDQTIVEGLKEHKEDVASASASMKEFCSKAEALKKSLEEKINDLKEQGQHAERLQKTLRDKTLQLKNELIRLSGKLQMTVFSSGKRFLAICGGNQTRYCATLDDADTVGASKPKLSEELGGQTGIYVFGYESGSVVEETYVTGVQLKSMEPFSWRAWEEDAAQTGREAILLKGHRYELTVTVNENRIVIDARVN